MDDAERSGNKAGRDEWLRRLHMYLDALFKQDPSAGAAYHDLQVPIELRAVVSTAFCLSCLPAASAAAVLAAALASAAEPPQRRCALICTTGSGQSQSAPHQLGSAEGMSARLT